MNKCRISELYGSSVGYIDEIFRGCAYPWEMLPKIKEAAQQLTENIPAGFTEYTPGVIVGENVRIAPTVVIEPPAVIGAGCELRPGAYLRGNVITGPDCVIGNSTELKNCVLMCRVQVPHYNYVGDSVLGNRAHMGAGAICSNLKSDGTSVVIHGDDTFFTGLRKVGSFLGDDANVGCGCVLNPGTVIGKNTSVYPMTTLRGVYPENCIVKSTDLAVPREVR